MSTPYPLVVCRCLLRLPKNDFLFQEISKISLLKERKTIDLTKLSTVGLVFEWHSKSSLNHSKSEQNGCHFESYALVLFLYG